MNVRESLSYTAAILIIAGLILIILGAFINCAQMGLTAMYISFVLLGISFIMEITAWRKRKKMEVNENE